MAESGIIKIGPNPMGSSHGNNIWDEKGKTKISHIFIWYNKTRLCSIQFQYGSDQNEVILSNKHGNSSDATKFETIRIDPAVEHITWISGFYDIYGGIVSLKFGTTNRYGYNAVYGPFGGGTSGHEEFRYRVDGDGCQFYGFHGTTNSSGLSIGLYLKTSPVRIFSSSK